MNIACYECGQAGHIQTNCPCLTKVRTAAVRADGTEDPEMDPQDNDEALPHNKEGEGDSCEHQEEQLDVHMEPQYQGVLLRTDLHQNLMWNPGCSWCS